MNILGLGTNAIEIAKLTHIEEEKVDQFRSIPLSKIICGRYQPRNRTLISRESLSELIDSIKQIGVLQPVLVRANENEMYEIIAGERRYLASIEAGLMELPCLVKNINEKQAFALAIVENVQRQQLTQLEESEALYKLKETHNLSVEEVGLLVGKPRTTIANLIRVSSLASLVGKAMCENGLVEFGHLRAVLSLDHGTQEKVLNYVVDNKLSVRRTENLVRRRNFDLGENIKRNEKETQFVHVSDYLIERLSSHFKVPVIFKQIQSGKIRMQIDFNNLESLDEYINLNVH